MHSSIQLPSSPKMQSDHWSKKAMRCALLILFPSFSIVAVEPGAPVSKFQHLDQSLPTPTTQRNASGAPGTGYWQNSANYKIDVDLDDENSMGEITKPEKKDDKEK